MAERHPDRFVSATQLRSQSHLADLVSSDATPLKLPKLPQLQDLKSQSHLADLVSSD